MLEFHILGPLEVVAEGGPVRLGGPKQRATLAILLLHANRVVSVERLADDLYAGAAPVTAVTQVQRQVSELRKALGSASVIETRAPGYLLHLDTEELDLGRFERRVDEGSRALAGGDPARAAELLRAALELWRGPPLADLAYESFARASIERLEEIRQLALEERIEADLALGRHAVLVGELDELVVEHPLRERFRGQLMLALYRSGRQAEALEVHRRTRRELVDQFGIEPSSDLRVLERAILTHDASLDLPRAIATPVRRTVLVVPSDADRLDVLLSVAGPLGAIGDRELIVTRLLSDENELRAAVADLNARVGSLPVIVRTAAFTTADPARDVARFAASQNVELLILDGPEGLDAKEIPARLRQILDESPADVAVLTRTVDRARGEGVFVVFGGGEHDWAALELGAWLALGTDLPLVVVGRRADPRRGQPDASRLLADASLAVQRVVGVASEPLLAEATEAALLDAVEAATLIVVGISPRWRREGIGDARRALVRDARAPALLVHRGPGPGGLAPRESRTRFTWSIEPT